MSVKRLVPLNAAELSSNPSSGRIGDIYYNTTSSELRIYNGTEWIAVQTGLTDHLHTYDGAIYSVGSITYPINPVIDGGTP
ncbi:hypothetical protein EB001_13550 [bacterium]|jgi:hypothetical protein|nr:hypothetical protein [bacterium]